MVRFIFLGVALISMVSLVAVAQQEVKLQPPPNLTIISMSNDSNNYECAVDEEGTYYYYPQLPEEGISFVSFSNCPAAPCEGAIVTKEGQVSNCD